MRLRRHARSGVREKLIRDFVACFFAIMARVRYEAVFIRCFPRFRCACLPSNSTAQQNWALLPLSCVSSKKMGSTGQMEPSAVVLWRFPRVFVCFTKCCFCASCIFAAQGAKQCHSTKKRRGYLVININASGPRFSAVVFFLYVLPLAGQAIGWSQKHGKISHLHCPVLGAPAVRAFDIDGSPFLS